MATIVKLGGGEPPKSTKPDPKKPRESALAGLSLSPQVLGIGAGVVVLLAVGLWLAFGRGGGDNSANATSPAITTPGGAPPGGASPAPDSGPASVAPAPGGSVAPASAAVPGGTSFGAPGAPPSGDALPPAPSMSSGAPGTGGSVSGVAGVTNPNAAPPPGVDPNAGVPKELPKGWYREGNRVINPSDPPDDVRVRR
jgi:hypothetical protein